MLNLLYAGYIKIIRQLLCRFRLLPRLIKTTVIFRQIEKAIDWTARLDLCSAEIRLLIYVSVQSQVMFDIQKRYQKYFTNYRFYGAAFKIVPTCEFYGAVNRDCKCILMYLLGKQNRYIVAIFDMESLAINFHLPSLAPPPKIHTVEILDTTYF